MARVAHDDISCMLGKTGGNGVAIGEDLGAETAIAALFTDSGFHLGEDLRWSGLWFPALP